MLNIDPVVKVNVNVGTSMASAGVFDVGAILTATAGTGTPLTTTTRYMAYSSLDEILSGVTSEKPAFADTTDVYKAAAKYFGVSPAPSSVIVVFYDTAEQTTDTPTAALLDAVDKGADIYGVYYSPKSGETTANIKANIISIASALDAQNRGVEFYGVTGTVSSVTAAGSVLADVYATNSKRAIGMYCTTDTDDAAGLMGLAMGMSKANEASAFALCYKSVASATVNSVTQTEVESIKALNGNVYVQRSRARAFIENGATASGLRFDDILYLDRMAYDIQQGIYSLIADSPVKLPQTDSTSAIFLNEIARILDGYYNYGVLAEAEWRGAAVGGVNTGDIIEHGHCEFADSFTTQSVADRALHKAMPITVLLCLSGSVESIVINVDVQT